MKANSQTQKPGALKSQSNVASPYLVHSETKFWMYSKQLHVSIGVAGAVVVWTDVVLAVVVWESDGAKLGMTVETPFGATFMAHIGTAFTITATTCRTATICVWNGLNGKIYQRKVNKATQSQHTHDLATIRELFGLSSLQPMPLFLSDNLQHQNPKVLWTRNLVRRTDLIEKYNCIRTWRCQRIRTQEYKWTQNYLVCTAYGYLVWRRRSPSCKFPKAELWRQKNIQQISNKHVCMPKFLTTKGGNKTSKY